MINCRRDRDGVCGPDGGGPTSVFLFTVRTVRNGKTNYYGHRLLIIKNEMRERRTKKPTTISVNGVGSARRALLYQATRDSGDAESRDCTAGAFSSFPYAPFSHRSVPFGPTLCFHIILPSALLPCRIIRKYAL